MAPIPLGEPDPPRARSYQLEMFEASLKDNIIVAMGTGSGKTHIAVLRIRHELEHSDGSKLIWFLAPTVALCLQQHKVIRQHIPTVKSRTLLGLDNVDLWTEQAIWDAVLKDIQVVVSTPAVLLDAMTHGFVRIGKLGLVVFDEAHHCTLNHPANKIMKLFYHPALIEHGPHAVPRILGLTASAASNRNNLQTIEANLDSVCTTPLTHRSELLEHTHRPELLRVLYTPASLGTGSETHKMLEWMSENLRLEDDPYVKKLWRDSPDSPALTKVLITRNAYCSDQLKRFAHRTTHIYEELGTWAAEYFIWASLEQLRGRKHGNLSMDLDDDEQKYLGDLLSQLPTPNLDIHPSHPDDIPVSPKFRALIDFLLNTEEKDFSGLIFVEQRATVAVMAHLLSIHPATRHRFQTGGFIGMSNSTKKKDTLGDLLNVRMQRDTLDDFRAGTKNLIVATAVLEEGIDVSACSVVVCYDKPRSLKSFVQRRGRARRQHSTYAIVLSTEDVDSSMTKWHTLERNMDEAYQEDRKRVEEARALENIDEDVHALFRIEKTGAILTADNAMQHLHHFCSTLTREANVDTRPQFSYESNDSADLLGKVTLPNCVDPRVRRAEGKSWWKTERAARKEAAFEAYKALYHHGLVNDNLLPLTKSREFTRTDLSTLPAIQDVQAQYDPWAEWADAWSSPSPDLYQSRMVIRQDAEEVYMKMVTPFGIPLLEQITLFWDHETTYSVQFEPSERIHLSAEDLESMRAATVLYLEAAATKPLSKNRDFITLFSPDQPLSRLPDWLKKNQGHERAQTVFSNRQDPSLMGIVRDQSRYGEVLLFKRWYHGPDGLELECDSYPKRRNLQQALQVQTSIRKRTASDTEAEAEAEAEAETRTPESPTKKRIISAENCTIDRLPAKETVFGRFIPVILDRLEASLTADKLCQIILPDIPFSNLDNVVTALSMPSALAPTDYQRYEFFGDSVLKFSVAASLFYNNAAWHEEYLTKALQSIVQNGRLARAATEKGLDRFILSKMFKARKWVAPFISEKLASAAEPSSDSGPGTTPDKRQLSTKVLADVVEALIGAAYIDGGHEKAQSVIRCFLPESKLDFPLAGAEVNIDTEIDKTETTMSYCQSCPPPQTVTGAHLINQAPLEAAIGHTFRNSSLLVESLTHPSCQYDASTQSYQRLEFLGDAVLDMLIVDAIKQHPRKLQQGDMTRIKHAIVNAGLLGFLCLEFGFGFTSDSDSDSDSASDSTSDSGSSSGSSSGLAVHNINGIPISPPPTPKSMHLYTYLRHSPFLPLLTNNRSIHRHTHLRHSILSALTTSTSHPWSLLSKLNADKFFSDIVESILGAIFVDSNGDLYKCRGFIERLGLASYVQRVLDEGIDVLHPMQKAQMQAQKFAARLGRSVVEGVRFECKTVRVARPQSDEASDEMDEGGNADADAGANTDTDTDADADADADADTGPDAGEATYTCTINLSAYGLGLDDVTVSACVSREDAEVQAASIVVETLQKYADTLHLGLSPGPGLENKDGLDVEMDLSQDV
ncbi:ATP-dependent helicase dcl2 [Aspergillus unguis]